MEVRKSPSGPEVAIAGGAVVFRPGGDTEGAFVGTWGEVEAQIEASEGFINVYFDDSITSITIPATASVDCQSRTSFLGGTNEIIAVTIEDGAQIRNPKLFGGGLQVIGAPTVRPFFAFTEQTSRFALTSSCQIAVTGGTEPAWNIPAGNEFSLDMSNSALLGDGANAVVNIEDGASLEIQLSVQSGLLDDSISGEASSSVEIEFDSSSAGYQPFANLLSTPDRTRIDALSSVLPSFGITGDRPAAGVLVTGQMYFDTTLGNPIWWDGAQWVDADGAPA